MLLFALIFAVGCAKSNDSQTYKQDNKIEGHIVHITSKGFYPRTITINAGEVIIWANDDLDRHWVASASHPVHDAYPGAKYDEPGSYQGTRSCIAEGNPKTGAFDACRELKQGEIYSFNFTHAGTWQYHDHTDYNLIGSVIVK